jgi:hypothetical protein
VASTIGLAVGTLGEGISWKTLIGTESVGVASSLANLSVSVTDGLSGCFTTIEATAGGASNNVTAVQASSIGLTVSTAGTNALGVHVAVFADSGVTPRLEVVCSTIVSLAVLSTSSASTASSVLHAVESGSAVGVLSARSGIFANTSGKIANKIVSDIQTTALVIIITEDAASVHLTVRSTGTSTVGQTCLLGGSGGQLAVSVSNARSTASKRTDGCNWVRERAKTVTGCSTENARDTSSLPSIDGSGFDLVYTHSISGNVEVNSESGPQAHDTSISKQLDVGTDGTSSRGRSRVDVSTVDGSLRSSQLNTAKSGVSREGNIRSVSL